MQRFFSQLLGRFGIAGLLLIVALGLGICFQSGNTLRYVDEQDYDQLARSLVENKGFSDAAGPTAFRPPGYPAFIAAAYFIGESPLAARVENVVALAIATVLLAILAARILPAAGALAPWLVLAYPLCLYCASLIYPQTIECLLLTALVLLLSAERVRMSNAMVGGVLSGILILAVPYFLLLLPFAALVLLWSYRSELKRAIGSAMIWVAAAAMIVLPWTARNYEQFHLFIPVSANGGLNLLLGNSPVTTPNGGVEVSVVRTCKEIVPGITIFQMDAAAGKCAVGWMVGNPGAAAALYAKKVVNYFNFRNEIRTGGVSSSWKDWVVFITYYPLLLLSILRIAFYRRFPLAKVEVLILGLYFLNALVSAIYFTRIRFRIPFDFLLMSVVAAFLCQIWASRRSSRTLVPQRPIRAQDR